VIRTIPVAEMQLALGGEHHDILRTYDIRMNIVAAVDNQGALCGFCGDAYAMVAVNIYATNQDMIDQCADCCLSCIAYVLDNQLDVNPVFPVLIEIAQGDR
jgi:hypothetical protein